MRVKARRRPLGRNRSLERPWNMGPSVQDQVAGFRIPLTLAVRQRGGWVSRNWRDGTRDKPKESD